jgi:hypothetical protein
MATSYDIIHKTVMGNKRVHIVSGDSVLLF